MRTVKMTLRDDITFERGMNVFTFYRMCFTKTSIDKEGRIVVRLEDHISSVYLDQLNNAFGIFVFADISDDLGEPEPADGGNGNASQSANASDGIPPEGEGHE